MTYRDDLLALQVATAIAEEEVGGIEEAIKEQAKQVERQKALLDKYTVEPDQKLSAALDRQARAALQCRVRDSHSQLDDQNQRSLELRRHALGARAQALTALFQATDAVIERQKDLLSPYRVRSRARRAGSGHGLRRKQKRGRKQRHRLGMVKADAFRLFGISGLLNAAIMVLVVIGVLVGIGLIIPSSVIPAYIPAATLLLVLAPVLLQLTTSQPISGKIVQFSDEAIRFWVPGRAGGFSRTVTNGGFELEAADDQVVTLRRSGSSRTYRFSRFYEDGTFELVLREGKAVLQGVAATDR